MRTTLMTLALCFGFALAACDDNGGDRSECSDAARADTVLDLVPDETAGAMVFSQTCGVSSCHGADGNIGAAPDLSNRVPDHDSEELACLLLAGQGTMPSQSSLSDQQLADVLAYVEATF
ncbi:MAG TPA: cytochrome c [Enhygromyxa sp.]|nr:cytochrome c [Enhygromyxa sp.]